MDLLQPLARASQSIASPRHLVRTYATYQQSSSSSSSSSSRPNPNYTPSSYKSQIQSLPPRPKPDLPTFFTGKPIFESALSGLEATIKSSTSRLRKQHVYPLPKDLAAEVARDAPRAVWRGPNQLSGVLATPLRTSQYRQLTSLLNELSLIREVARRSGESDTLTAINDSLQPFERREGEGAGQAKQNILGVIDSMGRAYTVGRRKESTARVWLIRTKVPEERIRSVSNPIDPSRLAAFTRSGSSSSSDDEPDPLAPSPAAFHIPTTQILINSLPIHVYFPRSTDRELILRPLQLTGLLGAFNIYAVASGGGTSGQAQAIALGVSRALVTCVEKGRNAEEEAEELGAGKLGGGGIERFKGLGDLAGLKGVRETLMVDGLLTRDGRTVERKKTGLAKADKRYAWVKR